MHQVLAAPLRLELLDDTLDVLRALPRRHHHRIRRLDHDVITHPDQSHQPALCPDVAVGHILQQHVALYHVALRILRARLAQRRPRTDVTPTRIQWHHQRVRGLFHDRVVDRVGGTGQEGLLGQACKIHIAAGTVERGLRRGEDCWRLLCQLLQIALSAEHEHAAVPVIVAAGKILLGARLIRFLYECLDGAGTGFITTSFDIAESRLRMSRNHPKGNQLALTRRHLRNRQSFMKARRILDQMISW